MKPRTPGRTFSYLQCLSARLNGKQARPFFWARLDRDQAQALVKDLTECAGNPEREWFLLTWTSDDVQRLRLLKGVTPDYERAAACDYARGDVFRVTGETSCNIDFSRDGAAVLARRLQSALNRVRRFVEIRVPNRHNKRSLIEFVPDTDLEAAESPEHDKLALIGEAVGAELLAREDFADWESADG